MSRLTGPGSVAMGVSGPSYPEIPLGVTMKPALWATLARRKQAGSLTAIVWGDSNDVCITSCDGNTDWLKSFAPTLDRRLCRVQGLHPAGRPSYQAVWVPASMGVGTSLSNMPTTNSPHALYTRWSASGFSWVAGPLPGYGGSPNSCYAITTANSGLRYLRYLLDQRNDTTNPPVWARNKTKFCVSIWYGARDTDTPISVIANTANTFASSPVTGPASDTSGYSPSTINIQVKDSSLSLISGSTQATDTRLPTGNAWQALTGVFTDWNTHLYGPAGTAQQYIEIEVPDTANSMCALGGILLDDGTSGGVRVIDLAYSGGSFSGRALEDRDNSGASTSNGYAGMGQRWMPAIGSWMGENWADRVESFWSRLINSSTGSSRKATFQAASNIVQHQPYSAIDAMFVNLFTNDYANGGDNLNKYVARATELIQRGLAVNPDMLFFFAIRPVAGTTTTTRDDPYTNASFTVSGTVKGLRADWVSTMQSLVGSYPANVAVLDVSAAFKGWKASELVRFEQVFGVTTGSDIVNFDPFHLKPSINEFMANVWAGLFESA
ncbi:MAG: hypothetical protein JST12_18075 [Armatimonadetes bacterium]|nr:hypothetical protein [Armatimonadota bacterium]